MTLIHRRDRLRAENILQRRLFDNDKVEIVWDSVVERVLGRDRPPAVEAVEIRDVGTRRLSTLEVEGLFVAIGHVPETELFRHRLATDEDGYIATRPDSTVTSVEGVFAAGDVQDKVYRQAVTAAGTGCMAALEAEKFLAAAEFRGRTAVA